MHRSYAILKVMDNKILDEAVDHVYNVLLERFGDPIGDYAGESTVGAHDDRADVEEEVVHEAKKRGGPSKKAAKSWIK